MYPMAIGSHGWYGARESLWSLQAALGSEHHFFPGGEASSSHLQSASLERPAELHPTSWKLKQAQEVTVWSPKNLPLCAFKTPFE